MSPTKTYTIAGERYELTPSQMIAYRQATMPGDVAGQAAYAHGHFSACRVASRALVAPVRSKPAAAKKPTSSAIDADLNADLTALDDAVDYLKAHEAVERALNKPLTSKYIDSEGVLRIPAGVVP